MNKKKKEAHQSFIGEDLPFGRASLQTSFDVTIGNGVSVVTFFGTSCTYARIISIEIILLAPIYFFVPLCSLSKFLLDYFAKHTRYLRAHTNDKIDFCDDTNVYSVI